MNRKGALRASALMVIVGFIMVIKSPDIGEFARVARVQREMRKPAGLQRIYPAFDEHVRDSYRLFGTILFGGGVLGFVLNLREPGETNRSEPKDKDQIGA